MFSPSFANIMYALNVDIELHFCHFFEKTIEFKKINDFPIDGILLKLGKFCLKNVLIMLKNIK